MKRPENNKWLDDALSKVIGSEKSEPNFEKWKQEHPQAVEMLTSRTSRASREVLGEIERRQTMSSRRRFWKIAALVTVVIGAGALATTVGLKIRKLYFRGREPDGTYVFSTEPEIVDVGDGHTKTRIRMVKSTVDPNKTIDVEQKIRDLEEIDLLRQQDTSRELLSVVETEVNGKLQPRSLKFNYVLADGREIKIMESDPDTQDRERSLTEAQGEEVISLLRADEYEVLDDIREMEVRGRMFSFKRTRFVLSDGTEVIKSHGRPK